MKFNLILSCFVALLALVNPIQKVLIVSSLQERFSPQELRYISLKSTVTAMVILIFFLYLGQVTFSYVFRVELYSFQITCGVVLMYNGLSGLLKGFFMKVDEHIKIDCGTCDDYGGGDFPGAVWTVCDDCCDFAGVVGEFGVHVGSETYWEFFGEA